MVELNTFIAQWHQLLLQSCGTGLLFLAAFFGAGKLLLRAFPRENTAAFALGTALLMVVIALLPPVRGVILAVLFPFALWGVRETVRLVKSSPSASAVTACLFLFFLGSALLPPYSWDEQVYQLAVPLRCLQSGSFAPVPDNPYSFYPALTGWFFANVITAGGITLPRILVGAVTPILLLTAWRLVRPFGKLPAFAATAALFLSPLLLNMNRAVYVENFIALFTAGGFFAAWKMRKKTFYAPLVCGILAGSAAAVKPTGAVGALFLFILFLMRGKEWKKTLLFCGTAFAVCFFWYLRTFLYTGNFLYPYALAPQPGSVEHFHHLLGSARYGLEGITGALLNWLFAGFDRKLFDGIVTGFQLPFLGAAAAAGFCLWRRKHPRYTSFVLTGAAALLLPLLLWSLLFPQSRFLLPLLPFAAAAGIAAVTLSPFRKAGYAVLLLLLSGALVFQAYPFLKHYAVSWRILPHVSRDRGRALGFLARDPGLYQAFAYLAESTPAGSRCLLLMERRGLYCPRPYAIACPGFEPSLTPVPESSEKMFEKLRNFDYIIVGSTTQDVDLQSANAEECKKVFALIRELIVRGKVKMLPCKGYPVLRVIKQ